MFSEKSTHSSVTDENESTLSDLARQWHEVEERTRKREEAFALPSRMPEPILR